jgi:hypothetical protein
MDTPRIRSRTFAGVLACAFTGPLLVLGACGGGDDSVADPPISSSPSSSSPTSAPHRETPEHFIRRFYAAEKAMENTGKTSVYEGMSRKCKPCSALVRQVRAIYNAGGFIHWGGLKIRSITGSEHVYAVKFVARPTKYRETADDSIRNLPGGVSTDLLTLKRSPEDWTVIARARTSS